MRKGVLRCVAVSLIVVMVMNGGMISYAQEENNSNQMGDTELHPLFNSWQGTIEENNCTYYDMDGQKVTGLQVIEGKTYFFDEYGILQTGWQIIGDEKYYFDAYSGERYENKTITIDGMEYSFDEEGKVKEGEEIIEDSDKMSSQDDELQNDAGKEKVAKAKVDSLQNAINLFDSEETTGWEFVNGKKYYRMQDGTLRVGWLSFGGIYYYCGADGAIVYGKQKIEGNWYHFDEEGVLQKNNWITDGDKKYYAMPDGKLRVGWLSFGSTYYYCGSDAAVVVNGAYSVDGVSYYFDENGVRKSAPSGWQIMSGKKYYGMPDGTFRVGWLSFGNTYYYCGSDGAIVYGKQKIEGNWYYFDEEGVRQKSKWITDGDKKYYAMSDGKLRVGWLSFGNTYYYCGADGAIVYGKQKIEGNWYYFDEKGVRQKSKWITDGDKKYYAMPDGKLRVGWLSFGSTYYYCGSDAAVVVNGPYSVDGVSYYFDENGVRKSAPSGWQIMSGKKYYGMPDGTFRVGWLSFGNTYYYCGSDGSIVYGKQKIEGNWYYFDEEGVRQASKWITDGDKNYYGMPDGTLRVGWLSFGSTYYYCGDDGAIVYGKQKIGGTWYYFNEEGIRQACKWVTDGGKKYYAMPDGTLRIGWLSFGNDYYYCDNDAVIIQNQSNYPIGGVLYSFDPVGIMQKEGGWGIYNGNNYYKNPTTGFPYKNQWVTFGSTYYYANENGFMVSGWQNIGGKYYYFYPDNHIMARNTTIDGYVIGADGARVPTTLSKMTALAWGYSSVTPYLILVDRASHKVGIFRGSQGDWENIKFWDCANGAPSTPTVSGVFTVGIKGYYFDSGASRCYWYTQFHGNYLFHSVLYNKNGTLRDGRVGMALSHGCVRLQIDNAKWIYDNIPKGTKVVVY